MNVGEPVVDWVDRDVLKKLAVSQMWGAVLALAAGTIMVMWVTTDDVLVKNDAWIGFAFAGMTGALAALELWIVWWARRAVKGRWGLVHARVEGDTVILGAPGSLAMGKGKRFARGDALALSVTHRRIRAGELSEWKISGEAGTVAVKIGRVDTEERLAELAEGLRRVGLTVDTAQSEHSDATGG